MQLPKQLEALRARKVWLCYPMIWNETKHNGVGGYDKPPINAYTLKNGSSDNPEHLATFGEAAAQIGKTAYIHSKTFTGSAEVVGVGIALSGTGIFGLDLDNVVNKERWIATKEAAEIMQKLDTYTEISPSGKGLHILGLGELPANVKKIAKPKNDIFGTEKAEYQLFDSGYMTVSGDVVGSYEIAERSDQIAEVYELYFREVTPIERPSTQKPSTTKPSYSSSVVSSATGYTYERWLEEVKTLSDAEILERIFLSGSTGRDVQALYNGDMSKYGNDHSRADQALCTYLYGFTSDRATTERLFRTSQLYRASGKSRNYLERTLNKASTECAQLVGHIVFTTEEKRAYAQKKEQEERATSKYGDFLRARANRKRGN